ncbi:MscL family protein [Egicoccus halophilus]|uniref:Large conductance mechanosensitive channel n=1 Tax=Egicoccus halophilus TaxID=1670830 RepID=A0A8J3ADD7_9ACTN|nr:MscL family protein [Egicoccus halophilus]GGI09502.1 hypothetical protein GCM10011354_34400 [Egicoccus halophilus]
MSGRLRPGSRRPSVVREFREFVARGSFVDLAVGFVMGGAVTGVVNALVERLIMPLIALLFGEPDFDAIGRFGCVAASAPDRSVPCSRHW